MVVVAQSAERLVVVQEVAGSTPVDHPKLGSLWFSITTLFFYQLHLILKSLTQGETLAVLPIVIHGNPVLHQPAQPVTQFDASLRQLIEDMYETQELSNGVGLAAPQVGVGLRLFTYKFTNDDGVPPVGVVVNPMLTLGKISTADPTPEEEEEGCLSFPGYGFPLKRAEWVNVSGFDAEGKPLKFEATGWFARVMQHETDHLDGKLYVNRLNKRWGAKAKKVVKKEGWTAEGNSWLPGVDPDPFGH